MRNGVDIEQKLVVLIFSAWSYLILSFELIFKKSNGLAVI